MTSVTVTGLHVGFAAPVLQDVTLHVEAGEVTAVLGASGTGKSTLLRCIAGLQRPDAGCIELGEQLVDSAGVHVPAQRRRVGLVPQEGALFPHLSVADNVGFGLKGRGRRERIEYLLDLLGLPDAGPRRPHELSGGMQQRVAVARALAPQPSVILLDEPFSALDASLREDVRGQVLSAIRQDRATAILVTHDQQEALAVADRVAVMMDGTIAQHDTPQQVYRHPVNLAVARFLGETVVLSDGRVFRPEDLRLGPGLGRGTVTAVRFHGHDSLIDIDLAGQPVQLRTLGAPPVGVGDIAEVSAVGPEIALLTTDGHVEQGNWNGPALAHRDPARQPALQVQPAQ